MSTIIVEPVPVPEKYRLIVSYTDRVGSSGPSGWID